MKKIEVNHKPEFLNEIAISLSILWVISLFIICSLMAKLMAVFLSLTILLIIIGIGVYIDSRKTIVEYDTEKVCWKWWGLTYTVNFSDLESVHYTIIHKRTRYDYSGRFEIVFKVEDDELRLSDDLTTENIDNCINGNTDNIKLMELYKFIENVCPEKSKGFIKDFWD